MAEARAIINPAPITRFRFCTGFIKLQNIKPIKIIKPIKPPPSFYKIPYDDQYEPRDFIRKGNNNDNNNDNNDNNNDNIDTISKTSKIKESENTNDTELPEYIYSKTFQGGKGNYVFKTEVYDNPSGNPLYIYKTGYYRDNYNL